MPTINFFAKAVKKDKRFLKLKEMLSSGELQIDTNARLKELKMLMTTRISRHLQYKEVVKKKEKALSEAGLQNQAYRSRVAEILCECNIVTLSLDKHLKDMGQYLRVTYHKEMLQSGYGTVTAQKNAVENSLSYFSKIIESIKIVEKITKNMIEDFDQTTVSLNQQINIFRISAQHEKIY